MTVQAFISPVEDKSVSSFSFVVEGTALDAALQRIITATGFDSGSSLKHHLLMVHNNHVSVVGFTNSVYIEVRLLTAKQVTGEGHVSITGPVLQGLIKNRQDIHFSFDHNSNRDLLIFKSIKGGYRADLKVIVLEDYFLPNLNDKITTLQDCAADKHIPKDMFLSIMEGVKSTSIKSVYSTTNQQPMTFVVYSSKNNTLRVFSYDGWHVALYRSVQAPIAVDSTPIPSFSLSFKQGVFDMIQKVTDRDLDSDLFNVLNNDADTTASKTGKAKSKRPQPSLLLPTDAFKGYRFGIVNNALALIGSDFRLLAPYSQAKKSEFETPILLLSKLHNDTPAATFGFSSQLMSSASNLYSLMLIKGLQYTLTAKESGVYLSIKTNNGDARDKIAVSDYTLSPSDGSNRIDISFDPEVFRNIVRCLSRVDVDKTQPTMEVYPNCFKIACVSAPPDDAGDDADGSDPDDLDVGKKKKKPSSAYSLTLIGSVYSAEG